MVAHTQVPRRIGKGSEYIAAELRLMKVEMESK